MDEESGFGRVNNKHRNDPRDKRDMKVKNMKREAAEHWAAKKRAAEADEIGSDEEEVQKMGVQMFSQLKLTENNNKSANVPLPRKWSKKFHDEEEHDDDDDEEEEHHEKHGKHTKKSVEIKSEHDDEEDSEAEHKQGHKSRGRERKISVHEPHEESGGKHGDHGNKHQDKARSKSGKRGGGGEHPAHIAKPADTEYDASLWWTYMMSKALMHKQGYPVIDVLELMPFAKTLGFDEEHFHHNLHRKSAPSDAQTAFKLFKTGSDVHSLITGKFTDTKAHEAFTTASEEIKTKYNQLALLDKIRHKLQKVEYDALFKK